MKRRILAAEAVPVAARPYTSPAPVKGWNAFDPVAAMKPGDAVYLDNWFPRESYVEVRKGCSLLATGPNDTIASPHNFRTLMGYNPPTGAASAKIFAAAEDGIYNVTAGGTVTAISSAATTNVWQWVNITTSGGSFLWCCAGDGVNKARYYNGSAWTVLDGVSTPALTGVTSADIVNVAFHKRRLMLCVKDKLSFYYLGTDSVAGNATEFPMGALFAKGGYLMATASWTVDDNGTGMDDLFVAITSEGEVAVYRGTDPANASTWALVGVYQTSRPLGRRCFVRNAGDLLILTYGGVIPLSKLVQSSSMDRVNPVTKRIQRAFNDYANAYGSLFGWQAVVFSEGPALIINVPVLNYATRNILYSAQFVMNLATGAWARFTDWNAECILVMNGKFYFAGNNKVYQGWTGASDNNAAIQASAKTFFDLMGTARMKKVTLVRPLLTAPQNITVELGLDADYADSKAFTAPQTFAQNTAVYDSAQWNVASFSSQGTTVTKWYTVPNARLGRALAFRLRLNIKNVNVTWNATDFMVKDAGVM